MDFSTVRIALRSNIALLDSTTLASAVDPWSETTNSTKAQPAIGPRPLAGKPGYTSFARNVGSRSLGQASRLTSSVAATFCVAITNIATRTDEKARISVLPWLFGERPQRVTGRHFTTILSAGGYATLRSHSELENSISHR